MTTTHATLSPSKRDRWSACPGSVREEARYPDERTSPAAIDGTHSHTLLAYCIAENADPLSKVGATLKDPDGEFVVDRDRAERVKIAYDYVQTRKGVLTNPVIASERKVSPYNVTKRSDLDGTADLQIGSLVDGVLEVADYKDGMAIVEPGCAQLRQYGVAVLSELNDANAEKIGTLRLTVIQPKLATKGIEPIRFVDFDAKEFLKSESGKLINEAAATDAPDAPLVPGDHCKYCKHAGACSARTNGVLEKAGISFPVLDDLKKMEVTTMTPDQIARIVTAAPDIEKLLESVKIEAQKRLERGETIEGLKLVKGRGARAWAFSDDEMAEKLKKFGIPKESIWETKLISPAKAEKVVWTKRDGTTKTLSDRQKKTLADEYISTIDGKPTVAPLSDPRPAITMNVTQMFAPVYDSDLPDWLKSA